MVRAVALPGGVRPIPPCRSAHLVVAALLAAHPGVAAAAGSDLIPEIQASPCLWPALTVLNEWGSAFRFARLSPDEPFYGSPTGTIGVWTTVRVDGAEIELARRAPDSVVSVRFDGGCGRTLRVDAAPGGEGAPDAGFEDADLERIRTSGRPTLVFAWSPHMPLSVAGLKEARAAARAMGVEVVGVLDPNAVRSLARETALREGIADRDLEPLASNELLLRGIAIHFPASVLVTARGVGELRRGYEGEVAWRRVLAAALEKAK